MARTGKGRGHRGGGAAPKPGPVRTCCGCREEAPQRELVRLVDGPEGVVVDLRGRMPGRGAWVHPRGSCVDAVEARPSTLGRSLHAAPSTSGLRAQLHTAFVQAALDGLSMAAAGGALVGGRDLLTRALRSGSIAQIVVASDASERTVGEYRGAADDRVGFTELPVDATTLGARIGKGPRAALGVRQTAAATHLLTQLRRLRDLG